MDRDHTLVVYGEDNDALYEAIAEHGEARRKSRRPRASRDDPAGRARHSFRCAHAR